MNTFKNLHPVTLLLYFAGVISVSISTFNPFYLILSLFGATVYGFLLNGGKSLKSLAANLIIICVIAVTNPIFSHNGATVLFFVNDQRITLEAFLYGAVLGLTVAAVISWFSCFNKVFDTERLLWIFGRIYPKIALIFSMALRFVPSFVRNFREINSAQGNFIEKNLLKRFMSSFSALVSRSMEDAIVTSDSMNARGYNIGRRTFFSRFRFTVVDGVCVAILSILTAVSIICKGDFRFYPTVSYNELNLSYLTSLCAFMVLSLFPVVFEVKERIKWHYSISKI